VRRPAPCRQAGALFRAASALLLAASLLGLTGCLEGPAKPMAKPSTAQGAVAIFAGGCFWCVEQDFEGVPGVIEAESGYTGGRTANPTYYQVGSGLTGHTEAVRVIYDPKKVSYAQLVEFFWRHIDPTARNRQFCDSGDAYRSGIYWQTEEERRIAEASRDALLESRRFPVIHTEIKPASTFWMAEQYHQDYYKLNSASYTYYRFACGRDAKLKQLWGGA
jgi:peptide-methionine (S)-S-oxide reductase